jgi:hypothetical protein
MNVFYKTFRIYFVNIQKIKFDSSSRMFLYSKNNSDLKYCLVAETIRLKFVIPSGDQIYIN